MQITLRYGSQSSVYILNKNLKVKPGVEDVLLRTFFYYYKSNLDYCNSCFLSKISEAE